MKSSQLVEQWLLQWFLAGVVLGVVVFVPLSSLGFVLPKLLLLSAATVGGVGALFLSRDHSAALALLPRTKEGLLFLAFFLVVLASLLWSLAPLLSVVGMAPRFEGILAYLVFFSLALIAFGLVREQRGSSVLLRALLLGNAIVVLYGLLQLLHLDPFRAFWHEELFLGRVFSTIGQPNFLGVFLLLTGPFVAVECSREGGARRLLLILLAMNVLVLLGTASRASLLGALVEVLLVLLVSWPAPLRALRRRGARWLGVTLLAVVLVVGIASFSRRFALPTQSATLGARRVIWEQSLKMIRARPWGYGLEAMGIASPRFRQRELNTVESLTMELDRAHSKPLDLLISLGPLGFLGYYAFLVLLFVSLWRRRRTDRFAPPSFLALVGASIALLFGFDTVVTHAFFWLIAGMALGSMAPPAVSPPSKRVRLLLGVLLGVLSVATVFFAVWALARIDLERSDQYLARGDTASSVRAAVSAAASFPFDRSILLRAVERSLLAEERAEDERSEGLLEAVVSLELRRLSTLTSGEDGAILLLRAWQAGLRGNASEAEQLLDRALAVEPTSVTAYSIAAHVERLLGNEGKRAQVIRQLLTLLPPWWQDRASPLGRILWKENPWLTELLPSAPRLRLP